MSFNREHAETISDNAAEALLPNSAVPFDAMKNRPKRITIE